MNELHNAILTILEDRIGRENRISRANLLGAVRGEVDILVSDREMRAAIEELRRDHPIGALICSSSGVNGYWRAKDYQEVLDSYREERRRSLTLLVTIRKRRDAARRHFGGQMRLV